MTVYSMQEEHRLDELKSKRYGHLVLLDRK
jgi:hypothetical protein